MAPDCFGGWRVPSGNLTVRCWKWPFSSWIYALKKGGFSIVMLVYQRVYSMIETFWNQPIARKKKTRGFYGTQCLVSPIPMDYQCFHHEIALFAVHPKVTHTAFHVEIVKSGPFRSIPAFENEAPWKVPSHSSKFIFSYPRQTPGKITISGRIGAEIPDVKVTILIEFYGFKSFHPIPSGKLT